MFFSVKQPNSSALLIGKDVARSLEEVEFYAEVNNLRDPRHPHHKTFKALLPFFVQCPGILEKFPVTGGGPTPEVRDLLLLERFGQGFSAPRIFDVSIHLCLHAEKKPCGAHKDHHMHAGMCMHIHRIHPPRNTRAHTHTHTHTHTCMHAYIHTYTYPSCTNRSRLAHAPPSRAGKESRHSRHGEPIVCPKSQTPASKATDWRELTELLLPSSHSWLASTSTRRSTEGSSCNDSAHAISCLSSSMHPLSVHVWATWAIGN